MVSARGHLRIIPDIKKIREDITRESRKKIDLLFRRASRRAARKIAGKIRSWVIDDPAIKSLTAHHVGSLKSNFGLAEARANRAISDIIVAMADSIYLELKPPTSKFGLGKIRFGIAPDIDEIAGLDSGSFDSEGKHADEVRWLEWLLTRGSEVILDFDIVESTNLRGNKYSRTGLSLMIHPFEGAWRVPPEFAGTRKDNFILRMIEAHQNEIVDIVLNTLENTYV